MKRINLAVSVLLTASLSATVAVAQASYKGEMMPMASATTIHHWHGFYAGLNIGAVQHTMDITDNQAATFLGTIREVSNPRLTGGLQLGYRWQLDSSNVSGVYGLEFSANLSNASFSQVYGSPYSLYSLSANNELKSLYLLQMIGGIAADKTFLFLAAGLSYTNMTGSLTNEDTIPFFNSVSFKKIALGTAVGGGIEYAFNRAMSVRLKVDVIKPNSYSAADNLGNTYQVSNNIVQGTIGVNYQFG